MKKSKQDIVNFLTMALEQYESTIAVDLSDLRKFANRKCSESFMNDVWMKLEETACVHYDYDTEVLVIMPDIGDILSEDLLLPVSRRTTGNTVRLYHEVVIENVDYKGLPLRVINHCDAIEVVRSDRITLTKFAAWAEEHGASTLLASEAASLIDRYIDSKHKD
jgi:hypothetical protein